MNFNDFEWDEEAVHYDRLRLAVIWFLGLEMFHTFLLDGSYVVLALRSIWLILVHRWPAFLTRTRRSVQITAGLTAAAAFVHLVWRPVAPSRWDLLAHAQDKPPALLQLLWQDLLVLALQYLHIWASEHPDYNAVHVL